MFRNTGSNQMPVSMVNKTEVKILLSFYKYIKKM